MRKLTEAKTKYYKAMQKVNQVLLPEYETILLNWFEGKEEIKEDNLRILEKKEKKEEKKDEKKEEKKEEKQEGKQEEKE